MHQNLRNEFPESVKRTIAIRVGYRCSNPTCGAPTSGPQLDPAKTLNIGVAAHVTAASLGGPRYKPTLTEMERKSVTNAIWLCQNCAKLVDNDASRFTESLLHHWKDVAERNASDQIGRQSPFDRGSAPRLAVFEAVSVGTLAPRDVAGISDTGLTDLLQKLVPSDIERPEDVQLLNQGRGALGQTYAILAVGRNSAWDWNVLFFVATEFGWELVARIDLENQKGYVPEVIYVPGIPGALAITRVDGWGTGVFRRSTSWYRVAKGEPVPLLSYPYSFYVVGWEMPFDRAVKSRLITIPSSLISGEVLEIEFTIQYTMSEELIGGLDNRDLLSTTEKLSLEWNDDASAFVPRTSNDDFAKIEELWDENTDGFVKRNFQRLENLANYGTETQRQFVRRYLLR